MSDSDLTPEMLPRLQQELEELIRLAEATEQDRAPVALNQQSVRRLSRMDARQGQAMRRIGLGEYGYIAKTAVSQSRPGASGLIQ